MGTKNYATLTTFDADAGDVVTVGEVECWAVVKSELQPVSGITFPLEDGNDLTISEETLAALGYVRA